MNKRERMNTDTSCPHCWVELDDDDGVFFDGYSDTKECPNCENEVTYIKQLEEDFDNPFCKFVWKYTYFEWVES